MERALTCCHQSQNGSQFSERVAVHPLFKERHRAKIKCLQQPTLVAGRVDDLDYVQCNTVRQVQRWATTVTDQPLLITPLENIEQRNVGKVCVLGEGRHSHINAIILTPVNHRFIHPYCIQQTRVNDRKRKTKKKESEKEFVFD